MNIERSIFKAYDIRGFVGTQISDEFSRGLGKAFVTMLSSELKNKKLKIAVGRDMRASSPAYQKALIEGIVESGADVVDIGLVSTPEFYFGVGYLECDGGIMVSASHNPAQYNGFKITRDHARPVSGDSGIKILAQIMEFDSFIKSEDKGNFEINSEIPNKFIEESIAFAGDDQIRDLKIVVDTGNGMGAQYLDNMLTKIQNLEFVKMYWDFDGNFPNHESNPFKDENNIDLQKRILEEKADLGIATDGDGDRIFFFDENAKMVEPAMVRGLIAQIMLRDHPGANIGYDIRPGKITEDMILEAGGKPFVTRVGHSLIKEKMIEYNSIFAGESSGHFFYKYQRGYFEGPVTVTVQIMQEMTRKNKKLSELVAPYRKYYHSGEINFEVEDKLKAIENLKIRYSDGKLNELDGITITYPDFWFNVRAGNTESILRLNLEATSNKLMELKRDEVSGVILGK
jgi:phosphomannomutase